MEASSSGVAWLSGSGMPRSKRCGAGSIPVVMRQGVLCLVWGFGRLGWYACWVVERVVGVVCWMARSWPCVGKGMCWYVHRKAKRLSWRASARRASSLDCGRQITICCCLKESPVHRAQCAGVGAVGGVVLESQWKRSSAPKSRALQRRRKSGKRGLGGCVGCVMVWEGLEEVGGEFCELRAFAFLERDVSSDGLILEAIDDVDESVA